MIEQTDGALLPNWLEVYPVPAGPLWILPPGVEVASLGVYDVPPLYTVGGYPLTDMVVPLLVALGFTITVGVVWHLLARDYDRRHRHKHHPDELWDRFDSQRQDWRE
jgi:hypothetical protein